ncbi:hypothetical protein EI533_12445 [Pseudomonas donghuensis]|nr:hypothetical protein [Pseudomonas donghuensis]
MNAGAGVNHGCIINDYVHVAPAAMRCHGVKVTLGAFNWGWLGYDVGPVDW